MYRQSESQEENFLSKHFDLRNKMISGLEISVNSLKKTVRGKGRRGYQFENPLWVYMLQDSLKIKNIKTQ
jgi:hypothetical protein